ncbi:hypothetical protein LAJ19_14760 (plasmid) [Deinococcus taeanensis]|uniref:hypothetical protein n=1 Tax=Deinococcus taeanensis TaxID=2737050 RepID=UPI001CDCC5A9|nr:hypothetical protein [Deinococcus taeanensis]UBV44424.1 hypothetical protein LAJ19_14760 [Deinococcus taeanensis]
MTLPAPQIYVTVVNTQTGALLRRLGPYDTVALARGACSQFTQQGLKWTRDETWWVAEKYPLEYRIPLEAPHSSV